MPGANPCSADKRGACNHAGVDAPELPPPASGMRMSWWSAPGWLRHAVEHELGAEVRDAVTQPGGFSPGVAARLTLAGGERVFVKAVGLDLNPDSPALHRAEARIAAALPPDTPAPRLLGAIDQSGWMILLYEDIDGHTPAQPWRPDELRRVLDALTDLAKALTPAPLAAPTIAERFGDAFQGWRRLAGEVPDDLDPWARRHLADLAALEGEWERATSGDSLVHADLRADNILLTADRVVVVDWPWACRAAPWFDLLAMLPSVRMQGGPPPGSLFAEHPVTRDAAPHAVNAALAALTGFLLHASRQPPPPGLPTLRGFQAATATESLTWLRTRTTWP